MLCKALVSLLFKDWVISVLVSFLKTHDVYFFLCWLAVQIASPRGTTENQAWSFCKGFNS